RRPPDARPYGIRPRKGLGHPYRPGVSDRALCDEARLTCQRRHRFVGAQDISDEVMNAETLGAAREDFEQLRAQGPAAPPLGHGDCNFAGDVIAGNGIARFADHGADTFRDRLRDQCELAPMLRMGHTMELGWRQLIERAEKPIAAGVRREPADIGLYAVAIP